MLFKGNSSRLQLLIEKIQSNNKDNNDEQDIEGIIYIYDIILLENPRDIANDTTDPEVIE